MSGSNVNGDVAAILAGIDNATPLASLPSAGAAPALPTAPAITVPTLPTPSPPPTAFTSTSGGSVSTTPNGSAANATASTHDMRVRVSPVSPTFYGSGASPGSAGMTGQKAAPNSGSANLMAPLAATGGVIFPYSPNLSFEQSVDYTSTSLVHANTDYYTYQKTPAVTITITGKFTVQNQTEGIYALACIHFFRTASKMYFGSLAGTNAGLPPPMLKLNGYGTYMFNNLNVILKTHSFSYNDSVDTVAVNVTGGSVRLPALFDLSCTLTIQQTPQKMRDAFNLDAFRTGALMQKGGWI